MAWNPYVEFYTQLILASSIMLLSLGQKKNKNIKKISMFPVAVPKTAMCNAVDYFQFYQ